MGKTKQEEVRLEDDRRGLEGRDLKQEKHRRSMSLGGLSNSTPLLNMPANGETWESEVFPGKKLEP